MTGIPVLLLSGSPRRRAILEMLGLEPRVCPPAGSERPHAPPEPARAYAVEQALVKLGGPAPARWLAVAADTIVVLDGCVLGKPRDAADARAMLGSLSGRTHDVITGVAVAYEGREASGWEGTRVTFRRLEESETARYVETGEPLDKAGAYGIQGRGATLVRGVEGCYFNVVGLPVARLLDLLGRVGLRYEFGAGVVHDEGVVPP